MKTVLRVKQFLILLIIMSGTVLLANAQSNLAFYNSNDQFNSSSFNPAYQNNQQKFTFSIFPLSGMSVGYSNQQVVNGMLLDLISGDLTKERMTDIFESLIEKELFSQRFDVSLISFGYHSSLGTFSFRINEVEQLRSSLKGDFTDFIYNSDFKTIGLNQPQNLYASGVHYREYSLGYAREIIEKKLTVGLRAKIYFGKASLLSEVQGQATGNNGRYYLQTNEPLNISVPLVLDWSPKDSIVRGATMPDNFKPVDYLFNSKNPGVGIDLGITYKLNQKILITASVNDLGKINWNSYLNVVNLKGKYEILPENLLPPEPEDDFITKSPAFLIEEGDLNSLFKSVIDTTSTYSTRLPTSFFAGMQYQISPSLQIGIVDRFVQSKGMNQNSLSLTANYVVNKKLTIISGYSTIGKSYNNIPLAILYNWSSGQTYLGTDNLMAFIVPSNADYAGFSFGTCFYLFKPKVKYKESEYLPFYKEKKHNK